MTQQMKAILEQIERKTDIALIGPEGSGKSSFLTNISIGELKYMPSNDQMIEYVKYKQVTLMGWDVFEGSKLTVGHDVFGVIIMLDGHDPDTLSQYAKTLKERLQKQIFKPVLILLNKADKGCKLTKEKVVAELGLRDINITYQINEVSVLQNQNIVESIDWLTQQLLPKDKM
uniref:Small Arf-related GTPase n=1 Tax=Trepomonas sp. PC1 TaxID=1076344 RepID=A0A146K2H0_9EUKA|eukprot:JAP90907.1 Small Arf-related GTPase [Trepomonas sp. PC1]